MTDAIQPRPFPPLVTDFCARELDSHAQQALSEAVAALPPSDRRIFFELIEELIGNSQKPAAIGLKKFPQVIRAFGAVQTLSWLDLGTTLAAQSSAAAQKYFSESPDLLTPIDPERRSHLLVLGLELSEGRYGVVMEFIRACPQLPTEIEADHLTLWMQSGRKLAEEDLVLAVEYFRTSPQVLNQLTITDLALWVRWGRYLVESNRLGKPDYLKAIEYFRSSGEILSALQPLDLRRSFLELGDALAKTSASHGLDFLRLCPSLLKEFDSPADRRLFLSQAKRLSDRDPAVVLAYLREGPKMFRALKNSPTDFISWVDTGLALLVRSLEQAKAYFSGHSKTGQDTTEQLIGGVSLKTVGRVLTLYAEGLSGRSVTIKPTTDLPEELRKANGDSPTTDGQTIYLPPRIHLFPQDKDNFRIYKLSTLHEAGHLEFGTYNPNLKEIRDLIEGIGNEYGRGGAHDPQVTTVGDFLRLFPDPGWAKALLTLLEDARVDYRLRVEYPGIRRDMDQIVAYDLQSRPKLEGLPPRMAIHEALLQLSMTDTTEVPLDLAETLSGAYDLLLEVKRPTAGSTDSLRILVRLYRFLEGQLRRFPTVKGEADPLGAQEQTAQWDSSSDHRDGGQRMSSSALSYRGTMHPDWVRSRPEDKTIPIDPSRLDAKPPASAPQSESRDKILQDGRTETATKENIPDLGSKTASTRPMDLEASENPVFFYDEWDEGALEYRPRWCRLYEHRIQPESSRMVQQTLAAYGPVLRLLRRHFQSLRPETFRKVKRQAIGEELDLDAVVEGRTEIRSGRTPQDRLYIKSEKRVRDVAVAFLMDMSGSTSRQIPSTGRRVIEVEQEALILMAEALQAIGDPFAIYGFSGDSKDRVDFYIIKDFSDVFGPIIHERIGAMKPLNQNRDGTAIRHTLTKLKQQPSKTRLLILLSDGKPFDTDYAGAHSLQDTKMALRETRWRGIHPYCITIDPEAGRYVSEMYGEVSHTIIDQVATLPERLPRIYKRLTT